MLSKYLYMFMGILIGSAISIFLLYTSSDTTGLNYFKALTSLQKLVKQSENLETDKSRVADDLYQKVRVLCWVLTIPKNHEIRAKHVMATWGRRCNKIIFMSSQIDDSLPAVALNVTEGREYLWDKTKEAFKYVYDHHYDEADWFLKADDDTYVVLENLRSMLQAHNPDSLVYFGCRFAPFVAQGYMSGGAGYIFSKKTLEKFVTVGLNNKTCSSARADFEDLEMGFCMQALGVEAGDTRDSQGRGRFFPYSFERHIIPGLLSADDKGWLYYQQQEGLSCCSDSAVSFHYVPPNFMYVMEYLIYHVKPFGIFKNIDEDTTQNLTAR